MVVVRNKFCEPVPSCSGRKSRIGGRGPHALGKVANHAHRKRHALHTPGLGFQIGDWVDALNPPLREAALVGDDQ